MEEEEGQVAVMVEETYERLDNVSICSLFVTLTFNSLLLSLCILL